MLSGYTFSADIWFLHKSTGRLPMSGCKNTRKQQFNKLAKRINDTHHGDKVAQLVRCRIGNQRVAGSNPGPLGHFGLFLGNIVYPILLQSTQLYNGYLA